MLTQEQKDFLIPKAYNAALRAGAAILDVYNRDGDGCEVTIKSDRTPLTVADRRAHNIIKDYLGRTHVPLLSEEGREMLYQERVGWDLFWMVDPLDGTKEFIKRNGEFTVNIALIADNRPALSVMYVPCIAKMYFASQGLGSFLREAFPEEDAEYTMEEIMQGAAPLPLAKTINNPLRVAVSRSHNTPETFNAIDALRGTYPDLEIIYQGSSYKFGLIAEGAVDYYVRTTPTMEWDTAAAELVLRLAGGSVLSHPGGKQLEYNKESLINPGFECRSKYMPASAQHENAAKKQAAVTVSAD